MKPNVLLLSFFLGFDSLTLTFVLKLTIPTFWKKVIGKTANISLQVLGLSGAIHCTAAGDFVLIKEMKIATLFGTGREVWKFVSCLPEFEASV